jgi:hypothetical protein
LRLSIVLYLVKTAARLEVDIPALVLHLDGPLTDVPITNQRRAHSNGQAAGLKVAPALHGWNFTVLLCVGDRNDKL